MPAVPTRPPGRAGSPELRPILVAALVAVLVGAVLVFAARRVVVDASGQAAWILLSPGPIDSAYARHPVLAYLHIGPGVVYLLGAPLQLSRRFRAAHLRVHRRLGRVVLAAGGLTGVFALVFGVLFPYGGPLEAAATVVFGGYFLVGLGLGLAAVRRRDVPAHRRWMIRAFAIALGVSTARLWFGLLQGFGAAPLLPAPLGLAVAFWIAWTLHPLAAELYLGTRRNPHRCAAGDPTPSSSDALARRLA
jgi:Predicted membrane protein (DUF2306)